MTSEEFNVTDLAKAQKAMIQQIIMFLDKRFPDPVKFSDILRHQQQGLLDAGELSEADAYYRALRSLLPPAVQPR